MRNKRLGRIDSLVNQICWVCKNACGGCEWSARFEPVPGWVAKKATREPKDSYIIKSCPKFEYDGQCSKCSNCPKPLQGNALYSDVCRSFIGPGNTGCFNFSIRGEKVFEEEYLMTRYGIES